MKSNLDNKFLDFVSSRGITAKVGVILALGLILILLGSLGNKTQNTVSEESRAAEMCSMIDGVGECRVMMTYREGSEEVYAVLVLCEGGESVAVRDRIISMFCSLYGIGSHRVEIQKLVKQS